MSILFILEIILLSQSLWKLELPNYGILEYEMA